MVQISFEAALSLVTTKPCSSQRKAFVCIFPKQQGSMQLIQVQAGGIKVQVKKKKGQYITLVHCDLKLPAGCDFPRSIKMQAGKRSILYPYYLSFITH